MRQRKPLGEILIDLGVLSERDVNRVLDALGRCPGRARKFGQMARDMGLLEEEHILAALAVQMGLFPGIEHCRLGEVLDHLMTATP
jgi:hypothetical protein